MTDLDTPPLERKAGEYGNSLEGILNNRSKTLTIPDGATVTFSARRMDTGEVVIDAQPAAIVDQAARRVRYDWRPGDLADDRVGVTLDCEFAIVASDGKTTYVPDDDCNALHVHIIARVAT